MDLEAFEKICQQLRKEIRDHYVNSFDSISLNNFLNFVQVRKVDQNEFEREIDNIKDRVLLSEEKIKESINKLKENVKTHFPYYFTQ